MRPKIFINLPIRDLKKSMDFYEKIGFKNNPQFTDDTAAAMFFSDEIFVMLLTHAKFKEFIKKEIADTSKSTAVILSLSLENKEQLDAMMTKALNAGAKEPVDAKDYGFMQQRSFEDPDGHLWELVYMDMDNFPKQ